MTGILVQCDPVLVTVVCGCQSIQWSCLAVSRRRRVLMYPNNTVLVIVVIVVDPKCYFFIFPLYICVKKKCYR